MKDFLASIPALLIVFFTLKWLYKTYIKIPQEDKQIGLYKFKEFETVIKKLNISNIPQTSNENCLAYREQITNGVKVIGYIEYSINDFIRNQSIAEKEHNYYFRVVGKIGDFEKEYKTSNYLIDFDEIICEEKILKLRNNLLNDIEYKRIIKLNQLR